MGVKFFSIDGGHTSVHARNDLALAEAVLAPGGVIALDDLFGPHWPGLMEGYCEFMRVQNRRLAPLLVFQNKLFLTTYSEHRAFVEELTREILGEIGDEFYSGNWKFVEMFGFKTIAG